MALFTSEKHWGQCEHCENGDGREHDYTKNGCPKTGNPCRTCKGSGVNLTDLGEELVEFLADVYGIMPTQRKP